MRRVTNAVMAAVMLLSVAAAGCATMNPQTKVKCPKCGHVFTIDEGRKAFEGS